jgi:hypothetical protein
MPGSAPSPPKANYSGTTYVTLRRLLFGLSNKRGTIPRGTRALSTYLRSSAKRRSVVRNLHDREVNSDLEVAASKSIEVWIGDAFSGVAEPESVADLREAALWLDEHAKKYYAGNGLRD